MIPVTCDNFVDVWHFFLLHIQCAAESNFSCLLSVLLFFLLTIVLPLMGSPPLISIVSICFILAVPFFYAILSNLCRRYLIRFLNLTLTAWSSAERMVFVSLFLCFLYLLCILCILLRKYCFSVSVRECGKETEDSG